jgi:hypothetical protein
VCGYNGIHRHEHMSTSCGVSVGTSECEGLELESVPAVSPVSSDGKVA